MQTLITKADLRERWRCLDNTIEALVRSGDLHPRNRIHRGRYLLREVEALENAGIPDEEPCSIAERRELKRTITNLQKKVAWYESKFASMKEVLES